MAKIRRKGSQGLPKAKCHSEIQSVGTGRNCPAGTGENSPAFERWVHEAIWIKPRRGERKSGTKGRALSSLTGLRTSGGPKPSVETPGYCRSSLRDWFDRRNLMTLTGYPACQRGRELCINALSVLWFKLQVLGLSWSRCNDCNRPIHTICPPRWAGWTWAALAKRFVNSKKSLQLLPAILTFSKCAGWFAPKRGNGTRRSSRRASC